MKYQKNLKKLNEINVPQLERKETFGRDFGIGDSYDIKPKTIQNQEHKIGDIDNKYLNLQKISSAEQYNEKYNKVDSGHKLGNIEDKFGKMYSDKSENDENTNLNKNDIDDNLK